LRALHTDFHQHKPGAFYFAVRFQTFYEAVSAIRRRPSKVSQGLISWILLVSGLMSWAKPPVAITPVFFPNSV